jgi:galacturan 1,4-alpha-galacturonidase
MLALPYTLALLPLYGIASPLETRENDEFIQYDYREGDSKPHHCILKAVGGAADDSDNLAAAVEKCGTDGVIELRDDV